MFSSLLIDAICESLRDTLGPDVLKILVSKGLLDNSDHPREFDGQLRSIFGDGARVLERVVTNELCRKLGIPYVTSVPFDYGKAVTAARDAFSTIVKG